MKLIVNGAEYEHRGSGTVTGLLAELGAKAEESAVMVNDEVVARRDFGGAALRDGDRVEVLTLMGGG